MLIERPDDHCAEEIMTSDVLGIKVGTTVKKAAELLAKKGVGCFVVLSRQTAVGIVTERDILNKITAEGVDPTRVMIEDIMSSPLIAVHKKSTITEIAEKMSTFHVRRAVVVNQNGDLAGLVDSEDLAKWLAKTNRYSVETLNAIARIKESGYSGPYG